MDTHGRSVVKGLTWRALAMLDTVLLALIFTGSPATALSIGGLELLTKVVWYYFHERAWLRIPSEFERMPRMEKWLGKDRAVRGFLKAVSWRFFGALDTFLIALLFTGEVGVSGAISGFELITKIVLYYLHDRAWAHVRWGKGAGVISPLKVASRLHDVAEVFRRHYRMGMVVVYAAACLLFVAVSISVIFILHRT